MKQFLSPFFNRWIAKEAKGAKEVKEDPKRAVVEIPAVNVAGDHAMVVWNVTLYKHTAEKHQARAVEMAVGSAERAEWDARMRRQIGRSFVMVIPSELPTAAERKAAGLEPWETVYTNRIFIPIAEGLTIAQQHAKVAEFAAGLQAEGKSVNLYNPEQPYTPTPVEDNKVL